MNKPIKLHPTDLIAVGVPSDAREFKIIKTELQTILRYFTGNIEWKGISFPKTDFEILGEINKDKISVDHNDNIDLRKLLKENGLNFVNDIEKPKGEYYYYDIQVSFEEQEILWDKQSYNEDLAKWQESENKLIKGKLIILKQT